jgi:transposase
VARRTATVRVRVLDRPLRSFRVGARHDFAMFSRAGDRAVGRLVNALIERLAAGAPFRELVRRYRAGLRTIERRHPEVRDTAVLDEIQRALEVPLTRAGYDVESLVTSA